MRLLLAVALALGCLALGVAAVGPVPTVNYTGPDFKNSGGPPDGVGMYVIDLPELAATWIEEMDTFNGMRLDPDGNTIITRGVMESWECDLERGPGAYKIAETVSFYTSDGELQGTARICCIGKTDLAAGLGWSAWNTGEGCPADYTPEPARLINTTLTPTELTCK